MEQKDFFKTATRQAGGERAGKDRPAGDPGQGDAPADARGPGASAGPAPDPAGAAVVREAAPAAPAPKARGRKKKAAKKKGGLTPMMEQFQRAKKDAPGALLFFRMGDFYELFGDDAVTASRELGITLTSRDKGKGDLPMAGVPVKAAEGYLIRLVRNGFKVAICEQLTDPRHTKGIVERGVVRIVTPGTLTEEDALDARESNFLASVYVRSGRGKAPAEAGLAWVDLSTGQFQAAELPAAKLADELARIRPAELLWPITLEDRWDDGIDVRGRLGPRVTEREDWRFDQDGMLRALREHFRVKTVEGYGFADDSAVVPAAGALVEYLQETQRSACEHVRHIHKVEPTEHLVLDAATRSCLELVQTQRGERREGTVLDAVDRSLTPMGGRLMREWLLSPLTRLDAIQARQGAVAHLVDEPFLREELRAVLDDVLDVERLVAKLSTGRANGRDLVALAGSLAAVPQLKRHLHGPASGAPADGGPTGLLAELDARLDPLDDVVADVRGTLVDEPPLTIKEGGLVRDGVEPELDELRRIAGDGKSWMAAFQAEEAARTGIQNLRIGYNSVFGYFLEVPRGQVDRVPEHYVRKQTIKTCERYITPELKEFETKVLKSEELSRDLEYDLFTALRGRVGAEVGRILDTARAVAELDVLAGLAEVAAENDYCRPTVDASGRIDVREGRHPVIEQSTVTEAFVPNDTLLDTDAAAGRSFAILTGPNMSGKSTYIRQVALIALLAQVGSFVPAREAHVGLTDRIFTRLGSGDDISRGASTFMVEMVEIANILNNATDKSLVILDEVGRGTSTFDGLAIAWALVEYLHGEVGARTLFATHYHQLTALPGTFGGIFNLNVAVRESGDDITFLHRIVEGGTDRSYGIHVAQLAGVPRPVLGRAKAILAELEAESEGSAGKPHAEQPHGAHREATPGTPGSPDSTGATEAPAAATRPSELERRLADLDVDAMTPVQALVELAKLRDEARG